jgi:hypothetical protein
MVPAMDGLGILTSALGPNVSGLSVSVKGNLPLHNFTVSFWSRVYSSTLATSRTGGGFGKLMASRSVFTHLL